MSTMSRTVKTWWARCDVCGESAGSAEDGWPSLWDMRSALTDWWLPGWGWALCPGCHERARRTTDLSLLDDFEAFARLCLRLRLCVRMAEAGS